MGKENDVILEYLDVKEHFADLFNGTYFNEEADSRESGILQGGQGYCPGSGNIIGSRDGDGEDH